ncbi:MAG: hypothetical protein JSU86_10135 [Phycisphaerales bacterium]|nr:MAG: hypothetical protein JSU86_10135 [Phycisphaerales bacterium]
MRSTTQPSSATRQPQRRAIYAGSSVPKFGAVLRLTEEEILTVPCHCTCCYNVEATVVDLAWGTYTIEFCWQD